MSTDKAPQSYNLIIKTDVYGSNAPAAAKAGVGARSIEQIRQATDARRNARPGQYNDSDKR